ncbi:NADH-quinone oxidoreductase subunit M [Methylacidimicrobium cyclopophantes]|uniref:NADH-quinone oxidoreductase subunit M n=1 Tax=Methylacidimicrobium cyclopophantes TaxID=1041766 RepID=A0A5E6M735_9BACT|nr:NADH-quinone oxidoreductase subunit M [Methylacidimicrobium cyclopophantes]VVM05177.1 NADH-quinone oxidoreductase subunit M [Methylacidimicrobium cyclopophantes]
MSPLTILLLVEASAIGLILFGAPPKKVSMAAAAVNFLLSLWLYVQFPAGLGGYQFVESHNWIALSGLPDIRYHVGVDGLSLPLVLLTTLVTLAAVWVAPAQIKRAAEFYSYLLLLSLGALGAFVSLDLFFFYAFHEFALIPTFLLIGIWGTENRQFVSIQLTLYLGLGSLVLLAGIIALLGALPAGARTFDIPRLTEYLRENPLPPNQQLLPFALLAAGFGTLVSLFPFHSWAPFGYASAPASAAMLHAGVLKKFGLYGLLRVAMPLLPGGAEAWKPWILALLLGNILFIGFSTIAQKELPAMLGFSSVMHMGYLFLGLACWNVLGISGVVFLMVAHGLSAALLFAVAGEVRERAGEIRFSELGGLARRMPFVAVAFLVGSFASVGVPGLANFPGELLIFFGSWRSQPLFTAVVVWGIVISAVYQLRAVRSVFYGDLPQHLIQANDVEGSGRIPYMLLMAALLILGIWPGTLLGVVGSGVRGFLSLY